MYAYTTSTVSNSECETLKATTTTATTTIMRTATTTATPRVTCLLLCYYLVDMPDHRVQRPAFSNTQHSTHDMTTAIYTTDTKLKTTHTTTTTTAKDTIDSAATTTTVTAITTISNRISGESAIS